MRDLREMRKAYKIELREIWDNQIENMKEMIRGLDNPEFIETEFWTIEDQRTYTTTMMNQLPERIRKIVYEELEAERIEV